MHPPQCFNRIKIIKYKINTQLFSLSSIPIPALHDWNIADKLKTLNINPSINRIPFNTILSHTYFCYNFHEILYVKVYELILFHFKSVQGCLMDNKIFTTDPKHEINCEISLLRHVFLHDLLSHKMYRKKPLFARKHILYKLVNFLHTMKESLFKSFPGLFVFL